MIWFESLYPFAVNEGTMKVASSYFPGKIGGVPAPFSAKEGAFLRLK